MEKNERALAYYSEQGFNCAQSVLAAFCEETGLEEKTALSVAGGLGGGAACGELCGAISGAVLALGMLYPHCIANDPETKTHTRAIAKEACERFRGDFGALSCRELQSLHGGKGRCGEFISRAAEIVSELSPEE